MAVHTVHCTGHEIAGPDTQLVPLVLWEVAFSHSHFLWFKPGWAQPSGCRHVRLAKPL